MKLTGLIKVEKKSQKLYLTNYNFLIAQDFWQAHYQTWLIVLLKEFIKLNVYMDRIIKNAKQVGLNTNIVSAVLDTQMLKMI